MTVLYFFLGPFFVLSFLLVQLRKIVDVTATAASECFLKTLFFLLSAYVVSSF
jgi:hypothetical protein